jgi:hypothetical protein
MIPARHSTYVVNKGTEHNRELRKWIGRDSITKVMHLQLVLFRRVAEYPVVIACGLGLSGVVSGAQHTAQKFDNW